MIELLILAFAGVGLIGVLAILVVFGVVLLLAYTIFGRVGAITLVAATALFGLTAVL